MQHRRQPLAERQQTVEAEALLMGGDLEDAVDGGVADRPAGALMLLAQPGDDLRPAGVAIAEDAVDPARRLTSATMSSGKAGSVFGK
jgi:hypothetical protein